jgi:DNA invertase Pin-like site-specific DNA recombinase
VTSVAIYARRSKDKTEQRISVENQLAACRKLAGELFPDLPVLEYSDNDLSGFNPSVIRPGFEAFLAAVRRGQVAQVVVNEQCRLTRQGPAQWEDLVVTFSRAGIARVHTVLGGVIDVSGSKLLGRILAAVDAEEAERSSARYKGLHGRLRDEGRPGGKVGYGYRTVTGPDGRPMWEVEPDEAAAIVAMSDAVCDGFSLNWVAAQLNDGTIPAPKPKGAWTGTHIGRLLKRPSLAGFRTRTVHTPTTRKDGTTGRRSHEEIVGLARWEPILSESRWRQTLDALNARTVKGADGKEHMVERKKGAHARRWLLTGGLGTCGRCGSQLYAGTLVGPHYPAGYRAYECKRSRGGCGGLSIGQAEQVDAWVHQQLIAYMATNPKLLPTIGDHNPERDRLEEDRRQARRTMDEADEMFAAGEIDRGRHRSISAAAMERFDRAQWAIDALPVMESDVPDLEAVRHHWDGLPIARKLKALSYWANAVVIGPGKPGRMSRHTDTDERIAARVRIDWKR